MKKKYLTLGLAFLMLLTGCAGQNQTQTETTAGSTAADSSAALSESGSETDASSETQAAVSVYPYTFTDYAGTEITLEKKPENVAVLLSSFAEVWNLSGGKVSITVGDSVERGFTDDTVILVNDGAGFKIDTEALIAAQPDLVIGSADISAQADACSELNTLGVPAAVFHEETFEDYLDILKICCDINEAPENYEENGTKVQEKINELLENWQKKNVPPVSYLFIRAGSSSDASKARTAENHFACVIMDELGGENIADANEALTDTLSPEYILTSDPEVILISMQGDETAARDYINQLFTQDGWKDLSAVRNGKYYFIPKDLYNYKPNARWAEAYSYLMDLVWPDQAE